MFVVLFNLNRNPYYGKSPQERHRLKRFSFSSLSIHVSPNHSVQAASLPGLCLTIQMLRKVVVKPWPPSHAPCGRYHICVTVLIYFLPLLVIGYAYTVVGITLWASEIPGDSSDRYHEQVSAKRKVREQAAPDPPWRRHKTSLGLWRGAEGMWGGGGKRSFFIVFVTWASLYRQEPLLSCLESTWQPVKLLTCTHTHTFNYKSSEELLSPLLLLEFGKIIDSLDSNIKKYQKEQN